MCGAGSILPSYAKQHAGVLKRASCLLHGQAACVYGKQSPLSRSDITFRIRDCRVRTSSMKEKHKSVHMALPLETFQHTHIAVYLCSMFAVACICYDSIQVCITWRCSFLRCNCALSYPMFAGCHAKVCSQSQMVLLIWCVSLVFMCLLQGNLLHHLSTLHTTNCRCHYLFCLLVHPPAHTPKAWFSFRVSDHLPVCM